MDEHLTPEEFTDRFPALFTTSAFRLETLPAYQSPIEAEPFRRWHAGQPDDGAWRQPWLTLVRAAAKAGKTMTRVHVVREPLTDYLHWQLTAVYPPAEDAGEDIRILITSSDPKPFGPDMWLIDDRHAALMDYRGGTWTGVHLTGDPAEVARLKAWRSILLRRAIPLTDYTDRIEPRRQPA